MENSGSVLAGLVGLVALALFGYWLEQERRRRRQMLVVLRSPSDPLVAAVEELMLNGQLSAKPLR